MNIAIVGLGLIGGSFAKAVKKNSLHTVIGIDQDKAVLSEAVLQNAIDRAGNADDLAKCDLTVLALYPKEIVAFMNENAQKIKKGSVVVDCAGVKKWVCEQINPVAKEHGFIFLGGHPMAGKEVGGFKNSEACLFKDASFIITPCEPGNDQAELLIKNLVLEIGFKSVVSATPSLHDEMIAFTSQLPHALACAYIFNPLAKKHSGFSAGSFRDVSRVAEINEELWAQLFLENSPALIEQIDLLIENLELIKKHIELKDSKKLKLLLKTGRLIKESIEK